VNAQQSFRDLSVDLNGHLWAVSEKVSSIIPKRINLDSYRYREARYHPRRRRNDPSIIWTIREVVLYFPGVRRGEPRC